MFGFLNVYKPKGITSHDVVAKLRRVLKIKQIGHTGTLDPFAQGVLPVCIGKATRLIEYLADDKAYVATVKFGFSTTTYDIEGDILKKYDKKVTEDDLLRELKIFEGEISQLPPIYSAIKVAGKKLYEYARENAQVEIKPRNIFIGKIELKAFDFENQVAQIFIKCSKGTYIRSIAHDLGENLGCGGHLTDLVRVQAGEFFIDDAIDLDAIFDKNIVEKHLINPLTMLDLPILIVDKDGFNKIKFGQTLTFDNVISKDRVFAQDNFVILVYNELGETFCAVAQVENDKIKVKKVFLS